MIQMKLKQRIKELVDKCKDMELLYLILALFL